MLGAKEALATVAVRDLSRAKKFYEGTLGLKPRDDMEPEAVAYRAGSSGVLIYRSEFAGTNKATAATWTVGDDIEKVVQTLESKGVSFEHYDLPGLARKGHVHTGGGTKAAWFKDPDGNILALVSG
jgi:predicted enzyme related to lactoylglutathione lyase